MMNWDSVKNFIGDAAPIVGGLLAPATGGISVAVGGLIAKTLGVEEKPEAVMEALQTNPEALLKIKELEKDERIAELQAEMQTKQMYADSEKGNIQTIVNAQDMYKVKNEQSDKIADSIFRYNLWLIGVAVVAAICVPMYIKDVAAIAVVSNITGMVIKTLFDERSTVINFFFGSSMGSRKAQEALINKG